MASGFSHLPLPLQSWPDRVEFCSQDAAYTEELLQSTRLTRLLAEDRMLLTSLRANLPLSRGDDGTGRDITVLRRPWFAP